VRIACRSIVLLQWALLKDQKNIIGVPYRGQ
jgi:hypothetical protein